MATVDKKQDETTGTTDPWVIVSTFTPTGKVHDGTTDAELYQSPYSTIKIEGPEAGYTTKEEAIRNGIKVRDGSCCFDDWYDIHPYPRRQPDSDDDDDEEEEEEKEKEGVKEEGPLDLTNDNWDSCELENEDNDEEQNICVQRLSAYNAEVARRNAVVKEALEEQKKKEQKKKNVKTKRLAKANVVKKAKVVTNRSRKILQKQMKALELEMLDDSNYDF